MVLTGRCYCGHVTLRAPQPQTVAYCHCLDCKRWTGAPLTAFAAFSTVTLSQDIPEKTYASGVQRRNCPECGSPLTARFDYLPDQTYVPMGVLDQAADYPPDMHCFGGRQLPWLHLNDDLPRESGTGQDRLKTATS